MKYSKLLDKRLLVVLLLLFSGVALLLNIRNRQDLSRRAAVPAASATMTLASNPSNLNGVAVGQTFTVDVAVTSPSTTFYGADIVLQFDRTKLGVQSVARGSSLADGCVTGTGANKAVLAPVVSETDSNCNFKDTESGGVVPTANSTGRLEFGVVAFDWKNTNASYRPTPFPSGSSMTLARVTFRVNATGGSTIKLMTVNNSGSACASGSLNCGTKDTNVAAVGTNNDVGDILKTLNPTNGLTVGSGGTTPTPGGNCPASLDVNGDGRFDNGDYSAIVANFGCSPLGGSSCPASLDVNGDGRFDNGDYSAIVANFVSCAQ